MSAQPCIYVLILYPVVYSGFDLPPTLEEVPRILSGHPPASSSLHTHVASKTFDQPILAVIVGGGYTDEDFNALYDASLKACGGSKADLGVVFVRADKALTEKLIAEGKGPKRYTPEYPIAMMQRLKGKLREVGISTGMEGGLKEEDKGKLYWY